MKIETAVVTNREAKRDYKILWAIEAGIQLEGCEVKSLREHRANLKGSFAYPDSKGNIVLYNMHITPYEQAGVAASEPARPRRLLLHKTEIKRLTAELTQKHLALIPLKVYFKKGLAKVELALGKGKRAFDKREDIKKREHQRQIQRAVKVSPSSRAASM
jgi:SsrA-binding protein